MLHAGDDILRNFQLFNSFRNARLDITIRICGPSISNPFTFLGLIFEMFFFSVYFPNALFSMCALRVISDLYFLGLKVLKYILNGIQDTLNNIQKRFQKCRTIQFGWATCHQIVVENTWSNFLKVMARSEAFGWWIISVSSIIQ